MNAIKRSSIAEHLVNNQSSAENFNLGIFRIVKSFFNISDLVKIEPKYILSRKPTLCRQIESEFITALFT